MALNISLPTLIVIGFAVVARIVSDKNDVAIGIVERGAREIR